MVKFIGEVMSSSAAVTVITGVLVFVGGQLIVKSAIEPYIAFKEQLGKISNLLLANQANQANQAKLANPCAAEMSEIIHDLKDAAAQLMAKHSALPFYIKKFHFGLRFVPSTPEILGSAQNLNLIASIHEGKDRFAAKLKGLRDFLWKNLNSDKRQTLNTVIRVVRGWINYHGISDNQRRVGQFIHQSRRIIYRWFNRKGGRHPLTWVKLDLILKMLGYPANWKTRSMFDSR